MPLQTEASPASIIHTVTISATRPFRPVNGPLIAYFVPYSVDSRGSAGSDAKDRKSVSSCCQLTERCEAAASLYETARTIVLSSLPPELNEDERRLAVVRRLYGDELPESALLAHSRHAS